MLLLAPVFLLAETRERPVCNGGNVGQVWPEKRDRGPCTQIEVCSYGKLRYRWRALTVNVSQLPKNPKRRGNCETRARTEPPVR
jgi:hypothetical protein